MHIQKFTAVHTCDLCKYRGGARLNKLYVFSAEYAVVTVPCIRSLESRL